MIVIINTIFSKLAKPQNYFLFPPPLISYFLFVSDELQSSDGQCDCEQQIENELQHNSVPSYY